LKNGEMMFEQMQISKGKILPKKNLQDASKLTDCFLSDDCFEFKTMINNEGKRRRIRKKQIIDNVVTTIPTEFNQYLIIDKITKNKGLTTYYYSEIMQDYETPKVIFSNSGYPLATYIQYPVNLSDNMTYYVPKNDTEGLNMVKIINSDIFKKVIESYSTNARDGHKIIKKLRKIDISKKLIQNDKDIEIMFGYY
jgi:hypothetical protein